MNKSVIIATLGNNKFTPRNGKGYDVSGGKLYTVKYNLLDLTFEVVFDA